MYVHAAVRLLSTHTHTGFLPVSQRCTWLVHTRSSHGSSHVYDFSARLLRPSTRTSSFRSVQLLASTIRSVRFLLFRRACAVEESHRAMMRRRDSVASDTAWRRIRSISLDKISIQNTERISKVSIEGGLGRDPVRVSKLKGRKGSP